MTFYNDEERKWLKIGSRGSRVLYVLFALIALMVVIRTYNIVTEPMKASFVKPGLGDYRVMQTHKGGEELEVQHANKLYVLEYESMFTEDADALHGPYPYEPGETLQLQVMCTQSLPTFYKELDDGRGERIYRLASFASTEDFCKGD